MASSQVVSDTTILPSFNEPQNAPLVHLTRSKSADFSDRDAKVDAEKAQDPPALTSEAAVEATGDDVQHSKLPSMSEIWSKYRIIFHAMLILLILGIWIPSVVRPQVRHYWVITTIWSWFFIGLIFFQYVPTSVFSKPIAAAWEVGVSKPWFKLPRRTRFAIGWVCLLALVFGSAFGVPLQAGTKLSDRAISVFGLFVFQFCFWLSCPNKQAIKWRTVIVGLGLQQILALLVLKTDAGFSLFTWIATAATDLLNQGTKAAGFFWSSALLNEHYFFINVLGAIIFFLALVQLLYYYGIMQWVLLKFAWFFFKVMGVSGAEAVVASSSPFIGQGESAALVKPYVKFMTAAEIHQSMASGFSTISGSVLGAYAALGMPIVYLVSASVMSIPASLSISKLRFPETGEPLTAGKVTIAKDDDGSQNGLQAFSNGAWFGLRVAGMILANVLTVLGLLYTIDGLLTYIGRFWGLDPLGPNPLTLELIFQYVFYPVAWLMGTPGPDVLTVSRLLGLKLIANEFVAYTSLSGIKDQMTDRGFVIATFSLCGFANLSSLGIQIGVLSSLAPNKRAVIVKVAVSALICGFMSTIQTASIAGMVR